MQRFGGLRTTGKLTLSFGIQPSLCELHEKHVLGLMHLKLANVNLPLAARLSRSALLTIRSAGPKRPRETREPTPSASAHRVGVSKKDFEEF